MKYSGSFPGFHLMLQPTLGFWSPGTGVSARTASAAARAVRGLALAGSGRFTAGAFCRLNDNLWRRHFLDVAPPLLSAPVFPAGVLAAPGRSGLV